MKICLLTHTFPRFKGDNISSIFMAELAQSLIDNGNEVWVLMPFYPSIKLSKKMYKVVTYKYIFPNSLHKLGYSETLTNDMKLPILMWILSPFMYFFGIIALYKLVKTKKIELINAHWILPNGFIASVVSLVTGVPVVSTLPGSDVYMARKNPLFKLLANISAKGNKWITSNSSQLIEDLQKITGVNLTRKSSTIPYGIGSSNFKPDKKSGEIMRKKMGFSSREVVILGVGRLVEKKGFKYLVKAAQRVLKNKAHIHFVLIGDGEQRLMLEKLTKKLGIEKNFMFLGNISYTQMSSYYNMADIFILPSIRDSKGNLDDQSVAVMDAMVCGKPAITTNFPGYRSIIESGKNGFLIQEKDVYGIEKVLLKLIKSEKLRQNVGKRGRLTIAKNFSWNKIGGDYTHLFNKLTNKIDYSLAIPKILSKEERETKARQVQAVIHTHLGDLAKLKCLDVGCSSGVITQYISKSFKKTIGIDPDSVAIALAQKNYKAANLKFLIMNAEKITYPANYFDVVVANQIYEFVDSPEKVFDEIHRVLKKGGVCFMGARNKFAFIEAQYKLPLLAIMPNSIASLVIRLTGRGEHFIGTYKTYPELRKLVSKFKLHDYTIKILRNPKKYSFKSLERYSAIARLLPLENFKYFLPNYIWVLEK